MSFSTKTALAIGALAYAAQVSAHGFVRGITVDGVYHLGGDPSNRYQSPPPAVAGWAADNQDNGFVDPASYTTADIACHKSAKVGGASIPVAAGSKVELHWNTWPESHKGPVIDYLAAVNGEFSTATAATLKWNKIAEGGVTDTSTNPPSFVSDDLIKNNFTHTVTIPSSIAPGNYVLRHEIIALHSAGQANGAQNYPQCVNFKVSGSGSNALASGTLGTALYTPEDKGIKFDLYTPFTEYPIPGPALIDGGASEGSTPTTSETPAASGASSAAAGASTTAAAGTGAASATPVPTTASYVATPTTLVTKTSPSASAPAVPVESAPAGGDDEEEYDTCA